MVFSFVYSNVNVEKKLATCFGPQLSIEVFRVPFPNGESDIEIVDRFRKPISRRGGGEKNCPNRFSGRREN